MTVRMFPLAVNLLLTVALAACASAPPRVQVVPDESFSHVESLVNEVGPRFAGTEGNAKAVAWALARLKAVGFANVHAEPVKVPHWVRGAIAVEIAGRKPRPLDAVALGGSVATPAGGITAPVVRVTSLEDLEWTPDGQVKGKIVFFDGPMQRTTDGTGYRDAVPQRSRGPTRAARKGAVGVVIRSVGTDGADALHTGSTTYEGDAKVPAAALSAKSANALAAALRKGSVKLRLAVDTSMQPDADSANVVADVPGRTGEIVLLAAHLDSWDITPGANDDGAGVATVIEAARRILKGGVKPQRTIRVVLYANEEFGLSGAKAYAAAHEAELGRHVLAMEADLGSGTLQRLDAKVPKDAWPQVQAMAQATGLAAGKNGEDGGSDIGALRAQGVPVLSPVADASKYFDVHHTGGDGLDAIDKAGLAANSERYAKLAWMASESPRGFGRLEGLARAGHTLAWSELDARPLPGKALKVAYGKLPEQFGELRIPRGRGPFPVALVVHGGCWVQDFDYAHATRISAALAASGFATWTIEYRRVGGTGGWPATFLDAGAGADELAALAKKHPLDLQRVVAVGHSAGGQLALWLAARGSLAKASELYRPHPLALKGVVALAPITDLAAYASVPNCGEAVAPLVGGMPEAQPARYAEVSPMQLPVLPVPVRILHGKLDRIVDVKQSQDYVQRDAGARLTVLEDAGHFEMVSPASGAWPALIAALRELAGS